MLGKVFRLAPAISTSVAIVAGRHAARVSISGYGMHTACPAAIRRFQSTAGRSPADNLSDELAQANILLQDLIDDADDCASDEFKEDLAEVTAVPTLMNSLITVANTYSWRHNAA
jgi:hypothetical protein